MVVGFGFLDSWEGKRSANKEKPPKAPFYCSCVFGGFGLSLNFRSVVGFFWQLLGVSQL
jgi:hypothetical protein